MTQKSVLIVDDDQTLVIPLKEGLEAVGYKVAVAFDGLQGVLQAHQLKPDAIILDFKMPGGDGPSVYERLRQSQDTARTPIIFSTVVSVEEIKSRITASSQTFFLKKPVGLSQFVSVLNSILGPTSMLSTAHSPFEVRPQAPAVARQPKFNEFEVRVTYADTDRMGVIYYANYFRYFEQGRTELMRSLGVRYRDLEVKRKLFIPVVESGCRYLAPSRYDDLLVVRTWISSLGRASIVFENEIYDRDLGNKRVARGYSRHVLVNDLWRAARIPSDLRTLLGPYVGGKTER